MLATYESMRNDWKKEACILTATVFSPKNLPFLADVWPCKAKFWVSSGCTNTPCQKGVYSRVNTCVVDSSSFFIGWRKNVGHFFLEEVFEKLKCCLFVGCDNILLMCLFVRTDSRRLKFCPAARFLHLLALYVIVNDMPCEKERTSLYIVYACAEVYLFLLYIKDDGDLLFLMRTVTIFASFCYLFY